MMILFSAKPDDIFAGNRSRGLKADLKIKDCMWQLKTAKNDGEYWTE